MKNLLFTTCALFIFLGLTSCSNNDFIDDIEQQNQGEILKSYKVQKDINGNYSIDYSLNSNTILETVKNPHTKSNDIYMYPDEFLGEQKYNEKLIPDNNKLDYNFFEKSESKTSFIIKDDNIILAKGENNNKFLQEYNFFVNIEQQVLELNFKVNKGVNVSFAYNEQEEIYEVHLKEGKSNNLSFSKIFKNDGNSVKVDFVNHLNVASRNDSTVIKKRPRILVDY